MQIKDVVCFILGGGKGTRLFPLTKMRSKPAVPLAGKYRLIDIPISNCLNSGIKKILVISQYNSASLNNHIAGTYRFDYFSDGFLEIVNAEQTMDRSDWFQGTADAVRQSMRHIDHYHGDYVLILSGDQLYKMDFADLFARHKETEAEITVATTPVVMERASSFGLMIVDESRQITEFKEKPPQEKLEELMVKNDTLVRRGILPRRDMFLANMGIYLFNRDVLIDILASSDAQDFGKEILPQSLSSHKVMSYRFDGYWEDIGTISAFFEANLAIACKKAQWEIYDARAPIYTNPRFLPPSKIYNSTIDNSLVSDGCILDGIKLSNCVLGIRTRINEGSVLEDTIVMGSDSYEDSDYGIGQGFIGKNCHIRRAIIDKNVVIHNNVRITNRENHKDFDGVNFHIRDGIVVIPKDAEIKSNTII